MCCVQAIQSLDSSLIRIQVELISSTQCLILLPEVCCSFIKTSDFFSNKVFPLLNWIMKYDIVRMLSGLLLSKEKCNLFFFFFQRWKTAKSNACILSYFGGTDMQVFLERFLLPPINISHLFSPFSGEERDERFLFVRKHELCRNKLLDNSFIKICWDLFFFQLILKFLFYSPYFHFFS